MRTYTFFPHRGHKITFQCAYCEFKVMTEDFDKANGNQRTQAVNAINQHVLDQHSAARAAQILQNKRNAY